MMIPEHWFEPESGHSWCESAYKYQVLPYVAEFANTITNLPIIVLPLVNAAMIGRYISRVNAAVLLPHLLLTVNGLASTYYHATLNLFGQLVDELSILWLINICLIAFLPIMKWFPDKFRPHLPACRFAIVISTALISILCFIKPSLNAFALMLWSIPAISVIYYEGMHSGLESMSTATRKVFILWGLACAFWFADRLLCDVWLLLGIPYLHAIFHLLSSCAAYIVFVMFSVLDINRRSAEHRFVANVRYFPMRSGQFFSLPYISLGDANNCE